MLFEQPLNEVEEDTLVSQICAKFSHHRDLILPPGDDCAAVACPGDSQQLQLLKTDCVVENVHFWRQHEPERVGWKAMARAVSDIAAMGGLPQWALVTMILPKDLSTSYVLRLTDGLQRCAHSFGVTVAGGETSSGPVVILNVALTGSVLKSHLLTRSGARPGHELWVTGLLGDSFRSEHHLDFFPRLQEAQWLASQPLTLRPSAMMDLSDGLASDLPRMAHASGCGWHLDLPSLPLRPGAETKNALGDGEDYELLVAMPPHHSLQALWQAQFPDTPWTKIGSFCDPNIRNPNDFSGWQHFG